MSREPRKTKREKKQAKRTAIVPRAVFAAAVSIGVIPSLAACGSSTTVDMGLPGVAARLDSGMDGARDAASDMPFSVAADARPPDMPFGVADLGPPDLGVPDLPFAVAVPLDLGPDSTVLAVAVLPDASFSVAAPIDT